MHHKRSSISKVGSGLLSIVTKAVPDRLLSPGIISNEIRRFRRHHESTIFERHRAGIDGVSDADKETLKSLCMRLLLFREWWVLSANSTLSHLNYLAISRGNTYEAQQAAYTEFTELGISDPLVRISFQQCIIDAGRGNKHNVGLLPDPAEVEDLHIRWSDFLGGRVFEIQDEVTLHSKFDALKASLGLNPSYSLPSYAVGYLASVYLSHALTMDLSGENLYFLMHLWEHFLGQLAKDVHHGGWEVMEVSVNNILSSGKAMSDFLSPSHFVGKLAVYFVWYVQFPHRASSSSWLTDHLGTRTRFQQFIVSFSPCLKCNTLEKGK